MIVSISHEHDLDGLGSQAIIKRYYDTSSSLENIKLLDANYSNFIEIVNKQLASEENLSELIISDIGFNKSFKILFNLFKSAKKGSCRILWFDHHIVDASIKKKIRNLIDVYVNDTKKCAAEILKDYFLQNDPVAIKIAEFARDTDFKTEKFELASDIQLIIGYNIGPNGFNNRRKIVELLSEGKFNDQWFKAQIKELEKWIEEESESAIQNVKKVNIRNFGDICISHAKIGGGKITQLLKKEYPDSLAYIGIDLRYNEIIIHSDFIQCREFARYFGGGGHENRAGFKHPHIFTENKELSETFIQDIKNSLPKFKK
jgi:oligoribonuclease NrnB/cAMP/cGMP phosphodiesterase (DHH superfamily)